MLTYRSAMLNDADCAEMTRCNQKRQRSDLHIHRRTVDRDPARHRVDAGSAGPDQDIETIYYAITASGVMQGGHSVRGQHAMREVGLNGIPLINIENACASGSTALNQAWLAVPSGYVDTALAIGAEKLHDPDKTLAFAAMASALDQDRLEEIAAVIGGGSDRSAFMETRRHTRVE
jgi:acetyl-CoA acetyltransferase